MCSVCYYASTKGGSNFTDHFMAERLSSSDIMAPRKRVSLTSASEHWQPGAPLLLHIGDGLRGCSDLGLRDCVQFERSLIACRIVGTLKAFSTIFAHFLSRQPITSPRRTSDVHPKIFQYPSYDKTSGSTSARTTFSLKLRRRCASLARNTVLEMVEYRRARARQLLASSS